uniref:Uncharacterized protein n=1 Tax=Timema poppense TaxID=170557 RepID=A0A7R9DAP3_TIMPO|nr:unnamed protein product [Timema poppensis]
MSGWSQDPNPVLHTPDLGTCVYYPITLKSALLIRYDITRRIAGCLVLGLSLLFLRVCECQYDCSEQEHSRCVKMADPLIKDPKLVFPDNKQDIEHMCR